MLRSDQACGSRLDSLRCSGIVRVLHVLTLSSLLRFRVLDRSGRGTRVADVAVDLADGDHPPVTRLLYKLAQRDGLALPWESVERLDRGERSIVVNDLNAGTPTSSAGAEETRLARDVLDALIVDLRHRRVTRANDVILDDGARRLRVAAADVGLGAILRRVTRGRWGRIGEEELCDWTYVEFLRGDPHCVAAERFHHRRIGRLPPGEIARLSDGLPYLHAAELLGLLPDPLAADTLKLMALPRQVQVFEELGDDQAARLLARLAPDAAARLVARLRPDDVRRLLGDLPAERSRTITTLLRYPEDTVGGIMASDPVVAPAGITIAEARERLRTQLENPDFIYYVYVVDSLDTRRLRGVLTLRNLLTSEPDRRLDDVMNPYVTALGPLEPASHAAHRVIDQHLAALPVVGPDRRLVGVVTVDAAVAQVAPASWRAQAPRIFS